MGSGLSNVKNDVLALIDKKPDDASDIKVTKILSINAYANVTCNRI